MSPWLRSARLPMLGAMLPAIALIAALVYFTAWAVTYSFTNLELTGFNSINWKWIGFDNYIRLFTRNGFLGSLWVTVVFTFFSALVGQSVFGFALAASMRRIQGWGRTTVEVTIMLGWLLPDIVAAFLWQATTSTNGFLNTLIVEPLGFPAYNFLASNALAVVIIANIWKGTAWSYLLFSAALDSISREILEAARVDGATGLQRIWLVTLPIIRPHIATNMLFITIWTFTYFPLIYALTGGGPGSATEVLSIFMYHQSFGVGKLGYGAAISVAMVIIVGALSIFYLRQLKEPK
ncbi:MAG TPA: sugar ABC transporter permease [Devosia sp.]|nr:sugar ABC transporter permease [Devosia sp.]